MDADKVLAQIRETIALRDRPVVLGQQWGRAFSDLATLVERLDAHLSGGGKPPEEWVEGPDAIGTVQDEASASIQGPDAVELSDNYGHRIVPLGALTCPIHGVVPEQDGGGCRLCDEGEVPDNG